MYKAQLLNASAEDAVSKSSDWGLQKCAQKVKVDGRYARFGCIVALKKCAT